MPKYDHSTHFELVRLLESCNRLEANCFGPVWEANEIDRNYADKSASLSIT